MSIEREGAREIRTTRIRWRASWAVSLAWVLALLAAACVLNASPPANSTDCRVLSAYTSSVSPDGKGAIRTLSPAGSFNLAPCLVVIIRLPNAADHKNIGFLSIVDGDGNFKGKLRAWVDAADVRVVPLRRGVVYEENPINKQLKDQQAVARIGLLLNGKLTSDKRDAVLIFEGEWGSLKGLRLSGLGVSVSLTGESAPRPTTRPASPRPATRPAASAPAASQAGDPPSAEATAASKLKLARAYLGAGREDLARKLLQEIANLCAQTSSAVEAGELLKDTGP